MEMVKEFVGTKEFLTGFLVVSCIAAVFAVRLINNTTRYLVIDKENGYCALITSLPPKYETLDDAKFIVAEGYNSKRYYDAEIYEVQVR